VPARLWPIFRDRDELPAATDLSETVREALAQSASLIVLSSPDAAASLWVAEEIETFRRLYPERPILAAIVEGDPPGCFPAALRAFGRDGTWHEPLATDLRPEGDGPHLGLLKLVAGITGVGLDALVQRDAQRRIRRVTGVTAGALVAMLLMAALTVFAINARNEAQRQRAEAEGLIEFMLTDLRERLRGVGRLDVMTAVNQRALVYYGDQRELSGLSPESLDRRARVLHAIGEDDMTRGNLAAALAAFRQAHRTTEEQLARAPDNPDRIFAHSQSEFWVGHVAYELEDHAAARQAFERYKALAEQLLAIDATNADWLREAAYAEGNLCSVELAERGRREAALRSCAASLERMAQIHSQRRDDPQVIEDLANRHAWLADAWNMNGRWDRVLFHRRRQEELAQSLIARDPRNLDYRDIWMRLQFTYGELLLEHGEHDEAGRRLADALATAARLRAADPQNETWRNWHRRISAAIASDGDTQ
jgi:tetratricopeptide (TPR) repeat protein